MLRGFTLPLCNARAKRITSRAFSQTVANRANQPNATPIPIDTYAIINSTSAAYNMSDIAQQEEQPQQLVPDQDGDEQVPNDEVRQVNVREAETFQHL